MLLHAPANSREQIQIVVISLSIMPSCHGEGIRIATDRMHANARTLSGQKLLLVTGGFDAFLVFVLRHFLASFLLYGTHYVLRLAYEFVERYFNDALSTSLF